MFTFIKVDGKVVYPSERTKYTILSSPVLYEMLQYLVEKGALKEAFTREADMIRSILRWIDGDK